MPIDQMIQRACETVAGYLELGNETSEAAGGRFVRNRATPRRWDANHVARITAESDDEIAALFARADVEFVDYDYRRFDVDPLTPPPFVARLALDGFAQTQTVQLLLEGDLRATRKPIDIRPAEDDPAWNDFARLEALDWQETTARQGQPFERDLLGEFTLSKRAKMPDVRYFLAYADGRAVAYFSSWPGTNGVGMVEDLFTQREYRHRGVATALIAHCVAEARARGAGPVIIGADPTDTPMRMYDALGFRPLMMTAQYFRRLTGP
jgi:GNAT superfamily N-acetyltransferase